MIEELKTYPVVTEIPVAWGDMDAMGHVNNTKYFQYYESARILYFARLSFGRMVEKYKMGPILASQNCVYKAAVTFPDKLLVGIKVSEIKEDSFVMKFLIYSQVLNRVAAHGEGNMVFYDYAAKKRMNLPERLVNKINRIENSVLKNKD